MLFAQLFALSVDIRTVKSARSFLFAGFENHVVLLPASIEPWHTGLMSAGSVPTGPHVSPWLQAAVPSLGLARPPRVLQQIR